MPEGSNSRWAGAKLPRPPLRTRQRSIKPAVAKKTYLDELPYYSSYQLAENEVPLARYLLPSDPSEVQRGVEDGRFPTLTNLARLQRQLGQPPNPSGDKANESPPAPFPPRRTKAELLGSTDFSATDEFARSVTLQPSDDWERLAQRLFEQSRSNLDKVRAAFCFACMHRDLPEVEHAGQPYENARAGNFNQVFAALLIIADVPMQVISGYKKGVGYESGLKAQLGGVWFACYVEGEWRFVDPHWAAQSISDYDTGNYGRIDQRGYVKTGTETDGTTNYQLNEFWFLTDPDQFAVNHFPSQDQLQWQLLARPLSFHEFEEIINYFDGTEQEMDHYQLEPVNYPKNLIVARPGPVVIQLKELAGEPYIYDRQLMIHRKHISEELKTAVLSAYQQRACLSKAIRVTKDTVKFVFEPPHQGQYALAIKLWRLVTEDALRGCTYATYTIHCPQSWESDDVIPEGLEDLDEFGAGRSLRQAGFASDAPGELKAADGEAELVIELLEKDGDSRSLMCLALGPDDQPLPAGSVLMWLDESRNAFLFLAPDSGYYALVLYEADQPVGQFLVDASSEAKDGGSFPLPDWDRVGGLGFAADPTRRARRLVPLSHPTPYVRTEESELSMQFGVISGDADTVLLCKESGEEKGHISDFGIIGSTVGKDESGITVGKDESGITVGKDENGITVGKDESGSTVGKDESGSTVGKDDNGSTVGKDDSGSTVGKDESASTIGKEESGSQEVKAESGSTVVKEESGKRPVVESGKYNGSDEMQSGKGDLSDDIITGGVGIGSCDEVKYNLAHSISVESDPGRKDFSNGEFGAKKDDVETHVGRIAIADVGRIELRAEMLVVGGDSSTEPLTDFCLVSGIEEGGYEVRCRFPRAGHYLLRLTSREGGGDWRLFYTYFVRAVGQLDGSAAAFPRLAHDWPAGGTLLEPLDRTLPVGLPTPFRIRLGDSTATAIDGVEVVDERSGHREALSRDPADPRLWVGSVTAQGGDSADAEDDKGGGVTVVARLEGGTEVELVKLDIESKASAEAKAAALREAESLNERRKALEENRKRKQENRNRRDQGLEPLLIKTYAEVIADVEANSAAALAKVAARRKALALASSAANAAAEANAALKSAVAAASGVKALARAVPKYVAQAQAAAKSAAMAESATIAAAEVEEISKSAEGARMTAKASAQAETSAKAATLATSQIEAILGIASEAETKTKLAAEAAANAATSSAFEAESADSAEADVAVKSAAASSEEAEASARAVAEIVVKVTTEFGVASKGSEMAAAAAEAAAKSAADANAAAKEASEMVAAEKAETKMLIAQLDAALLERSLARLRKTIQLLRRHEVKLRGTSLKKYQEAQLTLTALQHRKDLRDAMAEAQRSRNSQRLRTLVQRLEDEAEREPLTEAQLALFREDLRLAREAIQRDDRLERMPQHRLEMNPKSLTELRQYSRPVEAVHKTVQALLLLLGNYEKRTRKWPRCQPLLKNITKLVADFQPRLVDPRIAARSREILDGIDKREIALQSAAAFSFYEWAVKTTDSIKEVCTSDDFVPAKMAQQRCILGVTVEEDAELNFQDEGTRK